MAKKLKWAALVLSVPLLLNEVRGAVLAIPVLYAMWASGGTWMALYLGACSLGGIALSVIVPMYAARRLKAMGW